MSASDGGVWNLASRPLIAMVVLLCGVPCGLSAQQLSVTYSDGSVEAQSGASWAQLSIGDQVAVDSKLRLGEDAYVELRITGATISLSQPGTYSIDKLVTATRKIEASKAKSAIVEFLRNVVVSRTANQSTVLGARGANESTQEQDDWVSSTAQVFLAAGKEFIKSGEYPRAIGQFQKALHEASSAEASEIKYYLAYAYSLEGNTRDSFKQISAVQPTGQEEWISDYTLLRAKLLVDTFAFSQAVELLTGQSEILLQDEQRAAMYFLLLALGYRGIGDTENERKSLSKVISLPSDSDMRHAASEMLNSL